MPKKSKLNNNIATTQSRQSRKKRVKMRPLPQPVPRGGLWGPPTPRPSILGLGQAWRGLEEDGKGRRGSRVEEGREKGQR